MKTVFHHPFGLTVIVLIFVVLACNLPSNAPDQTPTDMPAGQPSTSPPPVETIMATITVIHNQFPSNNPPAVNVLAYDVESSGTAPDKRAPYGDSYNINRLERPFKQDMTYIPDLDIETFTLSRDADWYYVSLKLIGVDPNNALGINYGVEFDLNRDGFGDFIIIARPPYTKEWSTDTVQIYADKNRDTGGVSAEKSDAPFDANGYETLIFNTGRDPGNDPDSAWVRINAGANATVQFAFKRSLAGSEFMFSTLADTGLKDVTKLDYVDRFTETEAGSPIKEKAFYPLRALYAVDNTCRQPYGFKPTGYEPQLCPQPEPTKKPNEPPPGDTPQPTCLYACPYGQDPYPSCECWPG
jgi:hypothetical protein